MATISSYGVGPLVSSQERRAAVVPPIIPDTVYLDPVYIGFNTPVLPARRPFFGAQEVEDERAP